ncbi:LacI family DNA-binding transcriptional regulator [Chitinophaga sp. XS-30]|uniref:LacI family DNA-binding transcriptional regulator n=1 Tax=Chitinophaga sp. XS-30 TaxID=2604421 RepID=UPI0011DD51C1|nr:LacI family DNA-binding transcriptional regulator [Chitinophaga sp. XS-30]QEH41854.1 LacI family transcriptional regulator [Chitinophaga sp. XS-30]
MKHVTIRALAQALNLSVSTISKALRDSYEISEETKQRVLELAARLNYMPNPYASSLRGKQSRNIGVVIPEVADSFFSLAINGIESVVKEKGYHVLIYLTHEQFANEQSILREFQGGRVDGVLLSVSRETVSGQHILDLMARDIPVVFFDRTLADVEADKIVTDDFDSGYTATQHLLDKGCRQIAYLTISENLSISAQRMEGYLKALSGHGLRPSRNDIVQCSADSTFNYNQVKKMLQRKKRPDGILASVEKLANPVYQACRELSLAIPEHVKVICFSNLEIATILHPPLTTITQPAFEIGKTAASVLLKALDKKRARPSVQEVIIPSSLIIRESSGR